MPNPTLRDDELIDQVLEDERAAALQDFRRRDDSSETVDLAGEYPVTPKMNKASFSEPEAIAPLTAVI